jgi:hypothetical protein
MPAGKILPAPPVSIRNRQAAATGASASLGQVQHLLQGCAARKVGLACAGAVNGGDEALIDRGDLWMDGQGISECRQRRRLRLPWQQS